MRTVLGDIDPGELGFTYLHEHLIIDSPFVASELPHIHLPSVDEAVAELEPCTEAGLGAVVDAMPTASGRDVVRLAEISARTGVHIVAATGLHTGKYYRDAAWTATADPSVLADLFTAEVAEGISESDDAVRTQHRAGIIKVATTGPPTGREVRLFEAAVEARRRTGAPILTHCEAGAGALEQIELLYALGAPLNRVVLSHTDKIADPDHHRDLLDSGVNLEYDQGLRQSSGERRGTAWLLSEMLSEGYGGQLMLGTDGARRSLWSTLGGRPGLAWLLTGFADVLDQWGIDEPTRRTMLVDNPARFLTLGG